ncbi:unnamed protein product [Thelazia callipaeda]|uniref:EGF domain-specific O-linked N-acetylglucosamine transferase n=1 Tax=Thelazia callipaeda TaxID=103827 RepID=A0A0N5CKB0_THECL|nr:unnamed protein product [Thelazia callipaeda]
MYDWGSSELVRILYTIPNVIVKRVNYDRNISFLQQLEITHNSDIFIGMHGSGLTHLLFLPNWAVVFELYNCGDVNCYYDLSRLRGVKYFTWMKSDKIFPTDNGVHPQTGKPHKKFQNYRFDRDEFRRLVLMQVKYVQHHPEYNLRVWRNERKKYSEEL